MSAVTHKDTENQKEAPMCQDPRSQLSGEEQRAPRGDPRVECPFSHCKSPEVSEVPFPHP